MKIKNGNETVYEIITNHDFTLDSVMKLYSRSVSVHKT